MEKFPSLSKRVKSCLTTILLLIGAISATEPIFKFIPKASLKDLKVQQESQYDIEMVLGTHAAAHAIFAVNGPFQDGHAGMTGKSLVSVSKGNNVQSADFNSAATQTSSSAKDGLHDVIYKNFSSLSRATPSTETVSYNTLKLTASMLTVDKPGATSDDTLWVWASAEIGDQYVWVSEEATTILRTAGDRPYLNYTLKMTQPLDVLSGTKVQVNGSILHASVSRINAYNVKLRFYLPPYAEYVDNSYKGVATFSTGTVSYDTQLNKNELVILYPKIGITDKPGFAFHVRFKQNNLHLRAEKIYNATIDFIMSYCSHVACEPSGAIQDFKQILNKPFRARQRTGKFIIKHIPSGRCLSYTAGADSDTITFKAACTDLFTYDSNGGLKHVASSKCGYFDGVKNMKMSTDGCNRPTIIYRTIDGYLKLNNLGTCIKPTGSGLEGEFAEVASPCDTNGKFKFMNEIPASGRIAMGNKAILYSGNTEFFFCSRQSVNSKPSCFYKNGTYALSVKALPVVMAYVKAWDPAKSELYGIHFSGKCYVKINMADPLTVYQLEDSLWSAVAAKAGIKLSTDVTASALKDYPEQHLSSEFAVSLKGVHQMVSSTWKLVSPW